MESKCERILRVDAMACSILKELEDIWLIFLVLELISQVSAKSIEIMTNKTDTVLSGQCVGLFKQNTVCDLTNTRVTKLPGPK